MSADLTCKYMGITLPSPLIAGSCAFTQSVEHIMEMEKAGAGAVVLKSIFEEQISNEAYQSMESAGDYGDTRAIDYVRQYTEMAAYEKYNQLIRELKKNVRIPVIASIHCHRDGDWADFAQRVQEAGADALELNLILLSADPTMSGVELEKQYVEIIRHIRKNLRIPLAVKTNRYFTSFVNSMLKLRKAGADALVLFQRMYEPDIDVEQMKIIAAKVLKEGDGFNEALRWISIMDGNIDCSLSATSGVVTGEDAVKLLLAGADTFQIATVLYTRGIQQISVILDGIRDWMGRHGYGSIGDFHGKLSMRCIDNPEVYMRMQFMKYFAGIE